VTASVRRPKAGGWGAQPARPASKSATDMQRPILTTNPNPHHNPKPNPSEVGRCMVLDVWYQ